MKHHPRSVAGWRRALVAISAVLLLSGPALATWSIVVVNTKTGEVCIASATCIPSFQLKPRLAVLLVGQGAAACQSQIDTTSQNKLYIWNGIQSGLTPDQMIQDLSLLDGQHQNRQYGIVTFDDLPATFTGTGAAAAASGVTGIVGDLRYAIQGNIIVADSVVLDAEAALLNTPGDLSTKVMAGMEAARARGGDGRCSCVGGPPTSCGAPPPNMVFSSYTAFIALARMGDIDGTCATMGPTCANGEYYLDLRAVSNANSFEPVKRLERLFHQWRVDLRGTADHLLTTVEASVNSIVADGVSQMQIEVELRDIDGNPVLANPASLTIVPDGPAVPIVSVGTATDLGQGRYSFPVTAGLVPGVQKLAITVVHATKNVRLWPDLEIQVDPLVELHSGHTTISASAGGTVPLVVNLGAASVGSPYLLLGTSSGTGPGLVIAGVNYPLNFDPFMRWSLNAAGLPPFVATIGALDASGRAQATFVAVPGQLTPFVGRRIDWAAGITPSHATNVAGFDVIP